MVAEDFTSATTNPLPLNSVYRPTITEVGARCPFKLRAVILLNLGELQML